MIVLLAVIGALAFFMPPEPVEPPPIVETIQATDAATAAKALPVSAKLEAAAGLACIAVPARLGFRLARIGARRKRKETIMTDKPALIALMRKLETMSLILENATTDE